MGYGKAAVAAGATAGGSTTVRRMKAEDRVRRSNHRMKRETPNSVTSWTKASGEAEGYGPYKPIPPPKPSQQPQDRAECAPTPPPYRMPPLPVQPQQFQQHAASLPEGRGGGGVEAALPGAPEASPPLHTHSSKFPIEREVIVSSAEKASDTFKAKIPLIQDYGRRVGGAGVGSVGGGGMARGGGPVAVAPDAPVKQVAWTEESAVKAGRKGTPQHHHHHHMMSPTNAIHVGMRGQQQQFQNQDGNRQVREDMSPHPYNGHLTGAVPRRDWSHGPIKSEDMLPHGIPHPYPHSNHNTSRDDLGNIRSPSGLLPNQGPYGSAPCNTETAKYVQAQEDEAKGVYSANAGARHQEAGDTSGSQALTENAQVRMDYDAEGNVDRECDKIAGRLPNQSSNKAFPSRTYHHIKDMISSRFGGGGNKPKDGQLQSGGDVESGLNRREGGGRDGVSNQGLNNSGCRTPGNVSENMRATPTRVSALQQSSRKSNNLGEREEVHQRGETNQRDHYQPGKNDYDQRVEATPAIVTPGNNDGMGEQHANREASQSLQMFQQGMAPDADYGMGSGAIRKSGRREEMGSREVIDHGYASPQKGMMSRPQQHSHSPQSKRKEEDEHQMQGTQMSQLEYSIGSMQIGEPTYYSTPVGGEQGKQNNSNVHSIYSPDSNHSTNILMQHLRQQQQQQQGNPSGSRHSYGAQPVSHGIMNLNRGKEGMSIKSSGEEHEKEQQRQLGGTRSQMNEESCKGKEVRRGNEEGESHGVARSRQMMVEERSNEVSKGGEVQSCFLYQETIVTVEGGSAGGSVGGGSSDYEKTTHQSGRSTSTDSGRGTAGHGMASSRKGGSRYVEGSESQRERLGGQSPEEVEHTGPDTSTESEFTHPGSRHPLYGHNGLNPANDSEWVDVVESELRQILDPKLHVGVGVAMNFGIANSTVSESMSMTPPLPPLSPGGSPPASPTCSPKERGKNYKLSSSMPYISKPSQMDQKMQSGSHNHLQSHLNTNCHQIMSPSKGGNSNRLQQALSHSGIISMPSKGQQHGRQQRGGMRINPSMAESGLAGSRGGVWAGSGRANKGSSGDRACSLRKEQQIHGMGQNSLKAMLSNSVPLASFGAVPSFDNGDMTSTTTGLDLDSMLDGQTENTSDEDMSATIDTTDAQAIRRQLEGLENMYSEVLKLLGVKKHGSRYQPSDPRINKRRMYGSLSSIPSSVSSRPVRDKRRQDERKKVKDIKGINKRFQRLESHVVTLARSVAHLSSEMRTQHLMMQEMETIRGEIAQLRAQPIRSHSVPRLTAKSPLEKDSFCNNVPALTNPERVKKLTRFFGDEPPLLRIFLKKLGYEKYASAFEHERIGLVELPYLTEERLQKMGIPMGPRLRILQEAQISFCQENMNVYVV